MAALLGLILVVSACGGGGAGVDPERLCEIDHEITELTRANPFENAPAENESNIRRQLDLIAEASTVAPIELRDDIRVIVAAGRSILPVLEEAGFDFQELDGEAFAAASEAHEPGLSEANDNLDAWFTGNC